MSFKVGQDGQTVASPITRWFSYFGGQTSHGWFAGQIAGWHFDAEPTARLTCHCRAAPAYAHYIVMGKRRSLQYGTAT